MRWKHLILLAIPLVILVSSVIINDLNITYNDEKESYNPPICGDNICENGEEEYCLDCNLSCKSELCNSKINILCDRCTKTQKNLIPTLFEHQIVVYDCLANYYDYNPQRLIYHTISAGVSEAPCAKEDGCFISGGGFAERNGIKQGFILGLREYNETDVTKIENVGFEIHELAHVFTQQGLGIAPSWFTEGISIYTESNVLCYQDQILSKKISEFTILYQELKQNKTILEEIAPYDEYYNVQHNSHRIGSIYFGALEQDYNCNKECIARILYTLHIYRENCTGECFEDAKKSTPQLMNLSLNNNDLRVQIITNKIIKEKSEEVVGRDLTPLFEMLEIEY